MIISRRTMLGGAASAAVAASFGARAQTAEFTYKYANNLPLTHPMNLRAKEAVDRIKQETGGRVEIQIFPNNQLGSDTDMLSQVRSGGVEFFTLSPLILSTLVPNASISGIGFAFPNYDAVWKAMDGDLGAYVRGEIAKANLVVMDKIWDNGFRQITSSTKAIEKPDDLKGFKIRVPVSPLWTSMFTAFGSAPASINFAEVYTALQTKVVDGQENPLAIISTAKLFEVQKHVSMTNHMWDGFWFLANRRAWERLPEDLRGDRRQAPQRRGAVRARRRGQAQRHPQAGPRLQGHGVQRARDRALPGGPAQGGLLRRVEEEVRRRGLGHPGEGRRRQPELRRRA
jgi:tripartite ATP-independent transporter DctP family solute receptor